MSTAEAMSSAGADRLTEGRARLFALLGRLLLAPPDAALLAALGSLPRESSRIGAALAGLSEAARGVTAPAAAAEFHDLFIGVGRGEVLPFASYYLTGFLHERPLAELRAELARLGIARDAGMAEPEDHLGFLCEVHAGMLGGAFGATEAEAGRFFNERLAPWAGRCFADIGGAESARLYAAVGALGAAAIEIEGAAFGLPV